MKFSAVSIFVVTSIFASVGSGLISRRPIDRPLMSLEGRTLNMVAIALRQLEYKNNFCNQPGLLEWISTTEVCHTHPFAQREPLVRIQYAPTDCPVGQYDNCKLTNATNVTECTIHLGLKPTNIGCQDEQQFVVTPEEMTRLSENFLTLDDMKTINIVTNNLERIMIKSSQNREYGAYEWSKTIISPNGNIVYKMEYKPTDCPIGKFTNCKLLPNEFGIACEVVLDNVVSGKKFINCWDIK